jgi:hypothetical protein
MFRNSPALGLIALLLAGCSSGSTPLPPPASAPVAPAVPAPASPAPGITATSGAGGVETLSANVPASYNHPSTMAQGLCVGQIQSQLQSLVSLSQVGMPMTGMQSISQSQDIAQYFAPACKVTPAPGAPPIHGADNLSGQLGQWLSNLQIGRFAIKQQYIKVSPNRQLGRAIICIKVTLTYVNQLTNYEGWYNTEWIPVQGSWLIQSVTPIDVASATKVGDTIPQVYFDPYWGPGWGYY